MALSGVTVADSCIVSFSEFVKKKATRYLIFTIENQTTIAVDKKGERTATFEEFVEHFQADTPAYGCFDFEYDTPDGPREKLILITWIPDTSKPRARMLYSSSKEALSSLEGSLLAIQANDRSQLSKEEVLTKIKQSRAA